MDKNIPILFFEDPKKSTRDKVTRFKITLVADHLPNWTSVGPRWTDCLNFAEHQHLPSVRYAQCNIYTYIRRCNRACRFQFETQFINVAPRIVAVDIFFLELRLLSMYGNTRPGMLGCGLYTASTWVTSVKGITGATWDASVALFSSSSAASHSENHVFWEDVSKGDDPIIAPSISAAGSNW